MNLDNLDTFRLDTLAPVGSAAASKARIEEFRTNRIANQCGISTQEAADLIASW
jgi:hypothetical protein